MRINELFFHVLYCRDYHYRTRSKPPSRKPRILYHHELILVTEGTGWLTIDRKRHPIRPGMLFYIAPDAPHYLELNDAAPGTFLTVHFRCARVQLADENVWTVMDDPGKFSFPSVQEIKEYHPLAELFRRLVDGWNARLPGYEFLTKALLQQVLIGVYQIGSRQIPSSYSAVQKVEQAIAYMASKRSDRITVGEISELVQLSPAYFSRIFKESTGYTMIEYFNRMKIDQAKEMLLEGDRKIKEVAQELGFRDEFYFSRLFRQTAGISPSEFCGRNVHGV